MTRRPPSPSRRPAGAGGRTTPKGTRPPGTTGPRRSTTRPPSHRAAFAAARRGLDHQVLRDPAASRTGRRGGR